MLACRKMLVVVLALLAGPVWAHDSKLGDLVIMEPWARATIGQVTTAAAYLTVVNHGEAGDRLLAVSTPAAERAELHSVTMVEGVMKMRAVEAIEVAGKEATALEPGGYHVMLMGVHHALKEGDAFPLTLTFETAGSVEVEVHVQAIAAMSPGDDHAGHGEMDHSGMDHGDHGEMAEGEHDHGSMDHGDMDHGGMDHGEHGNHMAQGHHETISLPSDLTAPTLNFAITEDTAGGWNLEIRTTNFRFAPEHVNQAHRTGEGHAHLYVNGKKTARVYGPWFHIAELPSGLVEVTVTLNANDHSHLAVEDRMLSVTKEVQVP